MTPERRDARLAVNGVGLHVIEWGPAGAPPIVMLHGIRGFAETFERMAAALVPRWRVIAYDQRGRGDSDWDPQRNYHTLQYVADLEAVVQALDVKRFTLLGHSMGGIAALVYASSRPQRVDRLIVEDAGPGAFATSAGAARIRKELAEAPQAFASWDAAFAYMQALRPALAADAVDARVRSMLKPLPDGSLTWRHDHAGITERRLNGTAADDVDLWPCVRSLEVDTLVLRGARSDYLSAETAQAMTAANPRVRWREIARAGHYVHDDNPEDTIAAVLAFLGAAPPAARAAS